MQLAQDLGARQRPRRHGLADQAVLDVEVGQPGLEDDRHRIRQHAIRAPRGFDQHGLDLAPRRVVADGHHGVDDVADPLDRARVVAGGRAQHHRVGERDLLAHAGADLGGEGAHLRDRAFLVGHAHVLAHPKRARIDQDQSARGLPEQARPAEGDHQADQHRDALEGLAVRAGDVGIGHHDGEQPDADVDEAARRYRGVLLQPVRLAVPAFDAVEDRVQRRGRGPRDQEDHGGDDEVGDGVQHGTAQLQHDAEQVVAECLAPGPRVRELRQHVGEPLVAQHGQQQPDRRMDQSAHDGAQPRPLQQRRAGDAHGRGSRRQQRRGARQQRGAQVQDQPHRHDEDSGRDAGAREGAQQAAAVARLAGFSDDAREFFLGFLRGAPQGLAAHGIRVLGHEHQRHRAVDEHHVAQRLLLHGHRAGAVARQQLEDAVLGPPGALGGGRSEERSAQHGDLAVEHPDRGGVGPGVDLRGRRPGGRVRRGGVRRGRRQRQQQRREHEEGAKGQDHRVGFGWVSPQASPACPTRP